MLTDRDEEILQAVHRYRFMTALDICHLLYSPSSLTHVRERLLQLSGGDDRVSNAILYRFAMPKAKTGNAERVYAVGAKGREVLVQGHAPRGYHRPYKMDNLRYSFLLHSLGITRFLVACQFFTRSQPDIRIAEIPAQTLSIEMQRKHPIAIPDGFICFELGSERFPVLLEVDCGTEGQQQFKKGISARIEFVRSGDYARAFGIEAVNLCYIVVMEGSEQMRRTRRDTLKRWTLEVLRDQNRERWGRVFRFAESDLKSMYSLDLLQKAVWYIEDRNVQLFGE